MCSATSHNSFRYAAAAFRHCRCFSAMLLIGFRYAISRLFAADKTCRHMLSPATPLIALIAAADVTAFIDDRFLRLIVAADAAFRRDFRHAIAFSIFARCQPLMPLLLSPRCPPLSIRQMPPPIVFFAAFILLSFFAMPLDDVMLPPLFFRFFAIRHSATLSR